MHWRHLVANGALLAASAVLWAFGLHGTGDPWRALATAALLACLLVLLAALAVALALWRGDPIPWGPQHRDAPLFSLWTD